MLAQYSNADSKKAFGFAISLQNPQEQSAAVTGLFENWSHDDPEAAAAGWKKLPERQGRLEALDNVASSWGRSHPVAAKAWAENLATSAGTLAKQSAGDDPTSASRWAAALPNGPSRDAGLKAVSESWSQYDAVATAGWLSTLEVASSRDAAIEPLVDRVYQRRERPPQPTPPHPEIVARLRPPRRSRGLRLCPDSRKKAGESGERVRVAGCVLL